MKHPNVIDLAKVAMSVVQYGYDFQLKHDATLSRILEQFHKRADAQKRGA